MGFSNGTGHITRHDIAWLYSIITMSSMLDRGPGHAPDATKNNNSGPNGFINGSKS
jgi:hypothetical protein